MEASSRKKCPSLKGWDKERLTKYALLLIATIAGLYQVGLLYEQYSGRYTTLVDIGFPSWHQLPAITVCLPWPLAVPSPGTDPDRRLSRLIKETDTGQKSDDCTELLAGNLTCIVQCVRDIIKKGNWSNRLLKDVTVRPEELGNISISYRLSRLSVAKVEKPQVQSFGPSVITYDARGKCFSYLNRILINEEKDGPDVVFPYRVRWLNSIEFKVNLSTFSDTLTELLDNKTGKWKLLQDTPTIEINSPFKLPGSDSARLRWYAPLKAGSKLALWFYTTSIHLLGNGMDCSDYVGDTIISKNDKMYSIDVNSYDHCIAYRFLRKRFIRIEAMKTGPDMESSYVALANRIPFIESDWDNSTLINGPPGKNNKSEQQKTQALLDELVETCLSDCTRYMYEIRETPYEDDLLLDPPEETFNFADIYGPKFNEERELIMVMKPSVISPTTDIRHVFRLTPVEFLSSLMALLGMWVGVSMFSICNYTTKWLLRLDEWLRFKLFGQSRHSTPPMIILNGHPLNILQQQSAGIQVRCVLPVTRYHSSHVSAPVSYRTA